MISNVLECGHMPVSSPGVMNELMLLASIFA